MKFVSICYHHILSPEKLAKYPGIKGNPEQVFREHIRMLKETFVPITTLAIADGQEGVGVLPTFDDGLADHMLAADILEEYGMRGVFFVPGCVAAEGVPGNPNIVHFLTEKLGFPEFVKEYQRVMQHYGLDPSIMTGDLEDVKKILKYTIPPIPARNILIDLYLKHDLAKDAICLTREQIRELRDRGHEIGAHSHTHTSLGHWRDAHDELIRPKYALEALLGASVDAMSFPYGKIKDCQSEVAEYVYAFTIEEHANTADTLPHALGRYSQRAHDTAETLKAKLLSML